MIRGISFGKCEITCLWQPLYHMVCPLANLSYANLRSGLPRVALTRYGYLNSKCSLVCLSRLNYHRLAQSQFSLVSCGFESA